ncbi:hypothetical protein [Flavobacterium sp.]|uniref:hypothetical protein n=1 Tax=Flavobacterium sp. TaxID=239 RepID=UPI0037512B84
MKKITLLIVVIITVISCKEFNSESEPFGNNFYFENPQPINDSELSSIPNKFQGVYINSDSTYLNINKNLIFTESKTKFMCHKTKLDSLKQDFYFENGKYISKDTKDVFDCKKIGDSVELSYKDIDTLFIFSKTQKAKRINGNLTLNEKDSIFWKIKLISLSKNQLTIKYFYSDNDLKRMDSITKIPSKMIDSLSFVISPSRTEFKKFSEVKDFGFDSKFTKVKK